MFLPEETKVEVRRNHLNFLIIGDVGVGKSTILNSLSEDIEDSHSGATSRRDPQQRTFFEIPYFRESDGRVNADRVTGVLNDGEIFKVFFVIDIKDEQIKERDLQTIESLLATVSPAIGSSYSVIFNRTSQNLMQKCRLQMKIQASYAKTFEGTSNGTSSFCWIPQYETIDKDDLFELLSDFLTIAPSLKLKKQETNDSRTTLKDEIMSELTKTMQEEFSELSKILKVELDARFFEEEEIKLKEKLRKNKEKEQQKHLTEKERQWEEYQRQQAMFLSEREEDPRQKAERSREIQRQKEQEDHKRSLQSKIFQCQEYQGQRKDTLDTGSIMEKTVMILGNTGVGKSFASNCLLKEDDLFKEGADFTSCTTRIQEATRKVKMVDGSLLKLTVIDTPGLNDTESRSQKFLDMIITKLKNLKKINLFIIVMGNKLDGITQEFIKAFNHCLGGALLNWNNLLIISNKKSEKDVLAMNHLECENSFTSIFGFCPDYVCLLMNCYESFQLQWPQIYTKITLAEDNSINSSQIKTWTEVLNYYRIYENDKGLFIQNECIRIEALIQVHQKNLEALPKMSTVGWIASFLTLGIYYFISGRAIEQNYRIESEKIIGLKGTLAKVKKAIIDGNKAIADELYREYEETVKKLRIK